MNVVILAGGLGTRLRSVVKDVPKPMADIDGTPFLELLVREMLFLDPEKVVLCVSYMKEKIMEHFGDEFLGVPICYSIEEEPLGTGGAIKQAFEQFSLNEALVLNGDTYVSLDYERFIEYSKDEKLALVLKQVSNANRYGKCVVQNDRVTAFEEKNNDEISSGLINAGIYKINRELLKKDFQKKFSFEKDFLEKEIGDIKPKFMQADNYFIDIGVPEDYKKACKELKHIIYGEPKYKALFLDRDGVINVDIEHLHRIEDCVFCDGIFDLARKYYQNGYKLIVVTNQAGIGKGLYTEEEYFKLRDFIHRRFKEEGCPITAEYYCPYHPDGKGKYKRKSFFRKPNPGMILKAKKQFNLNLKLSVLIGDNYSDYETGVRSDIYQIHIVKNKL